MLSQRLKGMALCALAMVTVGSTVVASKVIAGGLPLLTATALRFAMALPVFLVLLRLTRTPWPRPGRRDLALLVCQAGLGSVGYTVLLILGVRWAPAASAGVVAGTLPAVAALVAGDCAARAAGAVSGGQHRAGDGGGAGDQLARGGPGFGGGLKIPGGADRQPAGFGRGGLRGDVHPAQQTPAGAGASAGAVDADDGLRAAAVTGTSAVRSEPGSTPCRRRRLAGVAYYALVPTVLGFVLWFAGSSRLRGAEAALFTAVLPVSALALAALWLGESISPAQIGGAACVLGAVGLASLDGRPPGPESPIRTVGL